MESDFIIQYIIYISQAYYSCIQFFINGRKVEHVESMVFDAKRYIREGGIQVLWQCYFVLQG
jgi:hypothetical protein